MGTGWRRAFCTTAPRNSDAAAQPEPDTRHGGYSVSPSPSPRSCVKLAFLSGGSNPSTPRPVSSPSLRCRTADGEALAAEENLEPLLHCKTTTPRSAAKSSNPSSPRSPLKLSLFRNSFKFRSSCGICLNSVKTGQGTAIYTAECSHAFHFPCISDYVRKNGKLVCPVCNAVWKDASLLAAHQNCENATDLPPANDAVSVKTLSTKRTEIQEKRVDGFSPRSKLSVSRFYDDDEPLISPRFVPIPEADENAGEEDSDVAEFKGFVVDPKPSSSAVKFDEAPINGRDFGNVQVRLLPESAVVSVGCGYETHAVALQVKAPPSTARRGGGNAAALLDPSHRAQVDLVAVLDVGVNIDAAKLQMVKRAMRLVISSLGSADRLSIIAVKRLLPLKRMTEQGKRAARRVIDTLLSGAGGGHGSNAGDALKKATRVLEDRRERNPIASIVHFSSTNGQDSTRAHPNNQRSGYCHVASNRFAYIQIPVHGHDPAEEAFTKCVGGLLSVVVQDLRIQIRVASGSSPCEISAVYLCNERPTLVSSGSGSVRLGDLYADEERELLVELRIPAETAASGSPALSLRGLYKDPSNQEVVYGRDRSLRVPQAVRSSSPRIQRLRNLFVATRAVAESRRLVEHGEFTSAHHLLTSARALLSQSVAAARGEMEEYVRAVETELVEVQGRRQQLMEYQHHQIPRRRETPAAMTDENGEALTPASAWRAAEKLAKVAMMKKSSSSDLHGFENARF
ncbi:PREDICTED: uncharacterized protein LOC104806910 [Tarenaya hassleriana]|uniref:uncharacterized protein LOC104806910 n=1 Tax=Tarenaya hassleriana TaxID=28532 RepID=UPI00053C59CC|nr:PREDICTED: uncharacterized protein LOC104806910 [Tarenaya hassleriana]